MYPLKTEAFDTTVLADSGPRATPRPSDATAGSARRWPISTWSRSLARTFASLWLPFLAGLVILMTQGRAELAVTINRMQPTGIDAFKALVIAIAIGNVLLTLLYVAGMALAAFHPQKRAAHDLVVGSESSTSYAAREGGAPASRRRSSLS